MGTVFAIVLLAIQACGFEHSVIVTSPNGLRTFTVYREIDGVPYLCPTFGILDPVTGVLGGQLGAREPVWITGADGRQLSVVWPQGFTVRFDPTAVLYNEAGVAVAWEGRETELSQISWGDAAGTYEDPYMASGILFGGCYPFLH